MFRNILNTICHCTLLSFWIAAEFSADLPCDLLEGLNVINAKGSFLTCWMLGLCKFLSSNSGRSMGRFIPRQPCAILLHFFMAISESVDWTVFSIILKIYHCEFSSLNSCRFLQRFNSRLAWLFLVIDLKGSHSTYLNFFKERPEERPRQRASHGKSVRGASPCKERPRNCRNNIFADAPYFFK